ncbi:MAG: adenylate kinase, partial [Chloroflexota bacterium]|nr:adenylate kinase [Chloroflexota bacterium]
GRMICSSCQKPFHKMFSPPREENSCDSCGEVLYQREDDKPAVVRNRLHVYIRETEPVVDYFEKEGNLRRIDASLGINEVRESLEDVVR